MTAVSLKNITKHFGTTLALDHISLDISGGELFFLLGPSGCGKSTLLRLIAGLHEPSSGKLLFNDRDVTDLSTEKRNAVMCFQSYALWPHMSVRENIRFGLQVRNVTPAEQIRRIDEALALVQMSQYADRRPNQLSGGQQQRVALARALAVRPDCLLLDEPLSNLDAKLRHEMRSEIRRICKTAGFTTIYVTHDQKEALSVADRICVLSDGKVMQVGTPGELYHRPASSFVADFVGATNLIPAKVTSRDNGSLHLTTDFGALVSTADTQAAREAPVGSSVVLSIRPERVRLSASASSAVNHFFSRPVENTFLGETSEHVLEVASSRLRAISAPPVMSPPNPMPMSIDPADIVVLSN